MFSKTTLAALSVAFVSAGCATAQDAPAAPPQITMGNGEANMIEIEGMTRSEGVTQFSEVRVDGGDVSAFRGDSVALTFPQVVIENPGFIVLHPVMDGRPNGDVVSGFTYLNAGTNENVTIRLDTPADAGRKFLVMLHSDVDNDRVLDFVFVEDGINVEDTAVFEGTHMIAHIFEVPE
ncbi:MAG: hypothetical protein NXH88_03100 [Hyphomonas sp.]|nr:hypothetical protein [Hyphomonas sp.]